jgi:hypothetical protein
MKNFQNTKENENMNYIVMTKAAEPSEITFTCDADTAKNLLYLVRKLSRLRGSNQSVAELIMEATDVFCSHFEGEKG